MMSPQEEDERVTGDGGRVSFAPTCDLGDRLAPRAPGSSTVLALLALVSGCSALENALKKVKPSGVERAPTFSAPALAEKGVVISAVACSRPGHLVQETSAEELASLLRASFLEEHPQMKVLMPDRAEQALGAEKYQEWLQYVQDTGLPRTEYLPEFLSELQGSVRYLLFVRLEEDEVLRSNGTNWVSDGKGGQVADGEHYSTSRATKMLFRVYDLETASMEWKGHFETTSTHSNVEPEESDFDKVLGLVDAVLGDGSGSSPYPEPVSIQGQTNEIFDEFVATLFDD